MTLLPSYDDVLGIPCVLEAVVGPEHIDANGHLNVRHFLDFNAEGTVVIVEDIGVTDDYRAGRRARRPQDQAFGADAG